jgi:GxxExxY protein
MVKQVDMGYLNTQNKSQGKNISHGKTQKYTEEIELNNFTYKINGAVFEVSRILGAGFLEKVYEKALLAELNERGLKVESQVPLKVKYKQYDAGEYFADIVVEDKIIIELKAVQHLEKIHEAQLLNYLKATGISLGLLVNFRHPKAEIKRFVM